MSTLHTNGAIATASRLLDMGAEGFLVAAALKAIIAQRLVRRICDNCSFAHEPEEAERLAVESALGLSVAGMKFQRGVGCQQCNNTGYRGRIGVYELLETNREMLDALRRGDTVAFGEVAQRAEGFRPFTLAALDYAHQGVTTLAEVLRISGEA